MSGWMAHRRRNGYVKSEVDNSIILLPEFCAVVLKTVPYKYLQKIRQYVGAAEIFNYEELCFSSMDMRRNERNEVPLGSNFLNWAAPYIQEAIENQRYSAELYDIQTQRMFDFILTMPLELIHETECELQARFKRDSILPEDWAYYMAILLYHGNYTIDMIIGTNFFSCSWVDLPVAFAGFLVAYYKTKQPKRQLLLKWVRESPTFPRYPKCLCMEVAKYLGSG
mgnify:FL=1